MSVSTPDEVGATVSARSNSLSLEARLASAGRTLASRVVSESPHSFLERFVREPSLQAVRFVSAFSRAYGFGPPRDLVGFSSLSAQRPVLGDLEVLPFADADGGGGVGADDAFEATVRHGGSSALLGLLIGALPIARTEAGDTFYVALYDGLDEPRPLTPRRVSRDAVFAYSWVKRALVGSLARDLSSFAYAASLADVRRTGDLDEAELVTAAIAARPHVARRSPFVEVERITRKMNLSPYLPPRSATLQMFARALWIFGLVSDDGIFGVDDVGRAFSTKHNPPPSKAIWDRYLQAMPTCVPTALYAFFRSYFFDDERRLLEAIAIGRKSPAKIVSDAARFFDDVHRGRRDVLVGSTSLSKAKAAFGSLGITSPPSSRSPRLAPVSRARAARAPVSERELPSSSPLSRRDEYRTRSLGDLEALAWERLHDETAHAAILRSLGERSEVERALRVVDYVNRDGHVHDNLVLQNEKVEALVALGTEGHPVLVPLLVARALREDLRAIEMLGALGDARATAPLLSLLDRPPQRYRHLETSVVSALRALGAKEAAPRLVALLTDNPLRDWKEGLERGPLVRELVVTLGALGASCAGAPLHELLASKSLEYRPLFPACAEALGRLEHAPSAPRLRELTRISATLRDGVPTEFVWALGQVGGATPEIGRAHV